MTKLDKLDCRLLYELDRDARQSFVQLGKKLRVHRNNVNYRLKRLEKKGIVRGFFTEVDIRRLGYTTFRMFLELSNYTPEDLKNLLGFIKEQKGAIWLFRTSGRYDVDLVYAAKDPDEFAQMLQELKDNFNEIIRECRTDLLIQIHHFPKDYLTGKKRDLSKRKSFNPEQTELDEFDWRLLELISENASENVVDIARKLNRDTQTVTRHMRQLEKDGIILGYRPFIDTEKTDHTYYKIHISLRRYTKEERLALISKLSLDPHVIYLTEYLNGDDIEAEMHLPYDADINDFLENLRKEHGKIIQEIYSLIFSEEIIFRNIPSI